VSVPLLIFDDLGLRKLPLTAAEVEKWAYAARVLGDVSIVADGKPLRPKLVSVDFPSLEQMKEGLGETHNLMFFVPGDAAKSWGANLPGSPVMAAADPEEWVTIFLVWVG